MATPEPLRGINPQRFQEITKNGHKYLGANLMPELRKTLGDPK